MYGMRAILLFGFVVTAAVSAAQDRATSKTVDEALKPIRSQIQGPLTRVKWAGSLYKNGETYTGQWLKRPPMNPTDYVCAQLANAIPLAEYDAIPIGETVAFTTEKSRIAKTIPGGPQIVKWARQMGPWMAAEWEAGSVLRGNNNFSEVEAFSVQIRREGFGYWFYFNARRRNGSIFRLPSRNIRVPMTFSRKTGGYTQGERVLKRDGEIFELRYPELWRALPDNLWSDLQRGRVRTSSMSAGARQAVDKALAVNNSYDGQGNSVTDWLLLYPNGFPKGTLLWIEKETEPWILLSSDAPGLQSPGHWNTNPEAGISYYAPAYKEPVAPVWMTLYRLHIQPPGREAVIYNFQGFRLADEKLMDWRDLPGEWRTAMEQAISDPYTGSKRPPFWSYNNIWRVLLRQVEAN